MTIHEIAAAVGYYRSGLDYWEIASLLEVEVGVVRKYIRRYFNLEEMQVKSKERHKKESPSKKPKKNPKPPKKKLELDFNKIKEWAKKR
jgi:transposase